MASNDLADAASGSGAAPGSGVGGADAPAAAEGHVDGRLARSARTRLAILDALRDLFIGGQVRPTAPAIAAMAGVSVRTVWQHFDDLQALMAEAGRREMERVLGFVSPIDPTLPLADRVAALVDQRAAMFEELAPAWRAARLHEPFSPEVREAKAELYAAGLAQLREVFGPELTDAAPAVVAAVQLATSWPAWDALRSDLGVDRPGARAATILLVEGLLA